MPAAAVDHIGTGDTAPGQQFVQIMLHEQVQKERPAAQRAQGIFGVDRIEELLDAGKICRVEQKSVLFAESRFLLEQCPAQVCDAVCLHIPADACRHGRRSPGVVVKGNIGAFAVADAGREPAELRFQKAQQRVDRFGLRLQLRQILLQSAHGIAVSRGRQRMLLLRQAQFAVLRLRRHRPAGMRTVQVGEHRVQRQIPPGRGALAFDLLPVIRCREAVGQIHDPCGRIRRQVALCAAQLGGVVIVHAVEHGAPARPGEHTVQKLIPLRTVAAALPFCTVHGLADIMQQPAKGGLQGKKVQNTISFVVEIQPELRRMHYNETETLAFLSRTPSSSLL